MKTTRGDSPMPLHVGDFLASTADWTHEERGLYLLLLSLQWAQGSIPADQAALHRALGVSGKGLKSAWNRAWNRTQIKFKSAPGDPSRLQNPRLEEHRQQVENVREKRRSMSRNAANARWNNDAVRNADGMRPDQTRPIKKEEPLLIPSELKTVPQEPSPPAAPLVLEATPVPKPKPKKPKPAQLPLPDYPPELNREAWHTWQEYRTKIGKALKAASLQAAMRGMVKLGDAEAQLVAVEHSMAHGYQGLFAPGTHKHNGTNYQRKKPIDEILADLQKQIDDEEKLDTEGIPF